MVVLTAHGVANVELVSEKFHLGAEALVAVVRIAIQACAEFLVGPAGGKWTQVKYTGIVKCKRSLDPI